MGIESAQAALRERIVMLNAALENAISEGRYGDACLLEVRIDEAENNLCLVELRRPPVWSE